MDPITIVGLVGTCTAITARLGALVESLPRVVNSYRDVERSIRRLGNQLRLFNGSIEELQKYLQSSARVSARVKTNLGASLDSYAVIVEDMQRHVQKVTGGENGGARGDIGVLGRVRHVWDEAFVNQCEQRVLGQMQMMDIYIRMVQLNNVKDQESILDSESTTTFIDGGIDGGNDDARTVRSEWETVNGSLGTRRVDGRSSQRPDQSKDKRRQSVVFMIRGLATTKGGRQAFARQLIEACENRNITIIQSLLKQGGSPNWLDKSNHLPLVAAVRTGQFTIVKALLDAGAKVNAKQFWTMTFEKTVTSYTLVFVTALYVAIRECNAMLTRFLISQGTEVTCSFGVQPGETALFLAITSGDADIVSAVLEAGADCEVNMRRP